MCVCVCDMDVKARMHGNVRQPGSHSSTHITWQQRNSGCCCDVFNLCVDIWTQLSLRVRARLLLLKCCSSRGQCSRSSQVLHLHVYVLDRAHPNGTKQVLGNVGCQHPGSTLHSLTQEPACNHAERTHTLTGSVYWAMNAPKLRRSPTKQMPLLLRRPSIKGCSPASAASARTADLWR